MDETKRKLIQLWLTKAGHDLGAAHVLTQNQPPILDVAIYHCHQAAEKAISGYLTFLEQAFSQTDNIELLIRQAAQQTATFEKWLDIGKQLTPYATAFRYPGEVVEPTVQQVKQALKAAGAFYEFVLSQLPRETWPSAPIS